MYHNLMNGGMSLGWTPETIGRLTPVQVMCLVMKDPPRPGAVDPADAIETARKAEEDWRADA